MKASMNLTGFSFSTYWSMVSGKEHCLVSVGSVYMFAHGFSFVLKLLSLTVKRTKETFHTICIWYRSLWDLNPNSIGCDLN